MGIQQGALPPSAWVAIINYWRKVMPEVCKELRKAKHSSLHDEIERMWIIRDDLLRLKDRITDSCRGQVDPTTDAKSQEPTLLQVLNDGTSALATTREECCQLIDEINGLLF